MDKLLVMPNPECKKPLACTLAKMRAEPQGMAALVGGGYRGRTCSHRVLCTTHGFGIEANVGCLGPSLIRC